MALFLLTSTGIRMNKLLVILGPTATGKTDLALSLAKKFDGELVSCDSRQVYVGLDIGTGKMPSVESRIMNQESRVKKTKGFWEIDGIKIWAYDVVDPKIQYTVAEYVKEATKMLADITARGKLPIVVGGTGFYLKALLLGLPNLSKPVDLKLRKELEKLSVGELQEKLKALSPSGLLALNESDRQNPRRLIRKLELLPERPTNPYMKVSMVETGLSSEYDVLRIGLTAPREVLYKNIDLRVLSRLDQGMVEEAMSLNKNGLTLKRMRQLGLEYGVLAGYLDGKFKDFEEMTTLMQNKIHGYLRRQQTWFKKEDNVNWMDITEVEFMETVENEVAGWYDS